MARPVMSLIPAPACVPAWLSRQARPTLAQRPSIQELKSGFASPSEMADYISAMAVQEEHAERCRGEIQRFLDFVANDPQAQQVLQQAHTRVIELTRGAQNRLQLKMSDIEVVGRLLVMFGCAQLMSQRRIGRSSTIRQILMHASRPWPKAMATSAIRTFLDGLDTIDPALPALAGVQAPRDLQAERLWTLIEQLTEVSAVEALWVTAGAMAGLRVRETLRFLMAPDAVAMTEGFLTWADHALVKNNQRGRRLLPDRYSWVPRQAETVMRTAPPPWVLGQEQAKAICRSVPILWKEAGVVEDARAFRRAMAVRVRETMVADGEPEDRAIEFVRWALGHREGSASTFRYLGARVSTQTAARLRRAQAVPRA